MGDTRQIVTGVADKGTEMVIRYWVQKGASKNPIKSNSLSRNQGGGFLGTYVRNYDAIVLHSAE